MIVALVSVSPYEPGWVGFVDRVLVVLGNQLGRSCLFPSQRDSCMSLLGFSLLPSFSVVMDYIVQPDFQNCICGVSVTSGPWGFHSSEEANRVPYVLSLPWWEWFTLLTQVSHNLRKRCQFSMSGVICHCTKESSVNSKNLPPARKVCIHSKIHMSWKIENS